MHQWLSVAKRAVFLHLCVCSTVDSTTRCSQKAKRWQGAVPWKRAARNAEYKEAESESEGNGAADTRGHHTLWTIMELL